jgi:hypothetical protein
MRTSSAIAACFGCAFTLFVSASARADSVTAESIEWVLATCDRVVVGKAVKVGVVLDRDKQECQVVTVAVSKTLKGTAAARETFLVSQHVYRDFAKQWRDDGIPIVFCLNKHDAKSSSIPNDKFAWVLRHDQNNLDSANNADAILLGESKHEFTGCIPVVTRDCNVLTKPEAILKYLEKTLAAVPKNATPRSIKVDVPGDTPAKNRLCEDCGNQLIIPVDDQTEALGQDWCKARSPGRRRDGARILGQFKSEKNIAILKSLLNDPSASWEFVRHKKQYYVRRAAFDALRGFGLKLEQPVLEEPFEDRDVLVPDSEDRKPQK